MEASFDSSSTIGRCSSLTNTSKAELDHRHENHALTTPAHGQANSPVVDLGHVLHDGHDEVLNEEIPVFGALHVGFYPLDLLP